MRVFMRIPLNWIKEYIDINWPVAQIAKVLTSIGIEVDSIEILPLAFDKVVVGRVLKTEKHPNAEKLCVASVTDGVDTYQVVCGASNCREGLKTALALIGATVGDFKIKQTKIRGVESFGMLCSGSELGISEEDEGIIEFEDYISEGTDVSELYGEKILDVGLTPNLGHCGSMLGIVRELSAVSHLPIKLPQIQLQETGDPIDTLAKVIVENKDNCPRYTCRVIQDVTIAPSPLWLQKKLIACGLRPINNVVDITNYVLLEMGHPLHAFDLDQLHDHTIIVRDAAQEEKIKTLDDKERTLFVGDILICDAKKPIAIAGVMGGSNSEVSNNTTNILLESAFFKPGTIRKTSKRLGLQTDASKKFERGTDPNGLLGALDRASALIVELAGGRIAKGIIDIKEKEFPERVIQCRVSRTNQFLGTLLSVSEVESIFQSLGFNTNWDGTDSFAVKVPTYRNDIHAEIDLIEEVARIYGYDNIGIHNPKYLSSNLPNTPIFEFERTVRSHLLSEGLQEFLNCDLIGPSIIEKVKEGLMPDEASVKVLNPVSVEQSVLRTSLMPGLLSLAKYNWDHQNQDINGFEVGRIHFRKGEHFKEQAMVGIILSGRNRPHHWDVKPREVDFYDLKGVVENLLIELRVPGYTFSSQMLGGFHGGRQTSVFVNGLELGSLGEVHPEILRRLDMPQRILYAELNLHDLMQIRQRDLKMQDIPIYPASERDWTISLQPKQPVKCVVDTLSSFSSPCLEQFSIIDLYCGDKGINDYKNVTFRFIYRDKEKTISQEKVDSEHARMMAYVSNKLKETDI